MVNDPYLQTLLVMLERSGPGSSIAITLTVRGFLVSGMLIGEQQWQEEFSAYIGNTPEAPHGQTLASFLRATRGTLDSLRATRDPHAAVEFVHLRDARFISPAGELVPQSYRVFWRGSLSSVDGFFFGFVNQAPPQNDSGDDFDDLHGDDLESL